MLNTGITERVRFLIHRIRERLWVKPLVISVLSIAAALLAKIADRTNLGETVPRVSLESVETLLAIMASSMLVIATFAMGAMVSAYSSASNTASPRSFPLVIADDVSQRALSTFIGAFIFSIVGLVALKNGYFETAGSFVLFLLTVMVFGMVIVTFVRWVDCIARLGRLGTTIDKVEKATAAALKRRQRAPALNGVPAGRQHTSGRAVFAPTVGYVQRVDIAALQSFAESVNGRVQIAALPGSFVSPGRALAYISTASDARSDFDCEPVTAAFLVGNKRLFDDDPRYGLVVLAQIAARALSPAVNDPGTAIDIITILTRLFVLWATPVEEETAPGSHCDRVEVPELSMRDMFDDAFTAIARDGSGAVEVAIRLQKALKSLASIGDAAMRDAAVHHARRALACAEKALTIPEDVAMVREGASFALNGIASD